MESNRATVLAAEGFSDDELLEEYDFLGSVASCKHANINSTNVTDMCAKYPDLMIDSFCSVRKLRVR